MSDERDNLVRSYEDDLAQMWREHEEAIARIKRRDFWMNCSLLLVVLGGIVAPIISILWRAR